MDGKYVNFTLRVRKKNKNNFNNFFGVNIIENAIHICTVYPIQ